MALIHSFERSGNYLFRYRSYFPILLFLIAIPVIYLTDYRRIPIELRYALTAVAIIVSAIGLFIRAVSIATTPKGTSGRNTKSGQIAETLNTKGIYSAVRHPLYVGNYFLWIGITIFTFNIFYIILVSLIFWLYYERIMFAEERFLESKFGQEYLDWSLKVPAFIPTFNNYIPSGTSFSLVSILRREYSGLLATVFSYAFIDHLRYFFTYRSLEWNRISTWVLLAAVLITVTLRSLKHYTNVLHEEDRS